MTNAKVLSKYKSSIINDLSIVRSANRGVNSEVFNELAEITGINPNFLAEYIFGVSFRMVLRYQKENKNFNPRNSETALKLIKLFSKGIEIFGSMNSFMNWLNKEACTLGNQVPLRMLNTDIGIDLIEEELIRIEFGALA